MAEPAKITDIEGKKADGAPDPAANSNEKPPATPISDEMLNAYKLLLKFQFGGAMVLVGVLAVGLLFSYVIHEKWQTPILVLVTLSGVLGSYFSALTRLHGAGNLSADLITPVMQRLGGYYLFMYSLVPPIVGGVAAVVLYVAFMGDFLGSGGLFPVMECKGQGKGCKQLVEVLNDFGPQAAKDYGKVLVWSFIAGFSERFVPDTLQSLVAKSQQS